MSCSQTMKSSSHIQHTVMSQHDMLMADEHTAHSTNVDSSINVSPIEESNGSCCDESCFCDMVNCSTNIVTNQFYEGITQNNHTQMRTWLRKQDTQTQYLNYLFKPPIQSQS